MIQEAKELGVSFVLLAGGDPLLRKKVIEKAAKVT
jgi:MoaA/NifB/PqqE/SkfB family radical SAM enzyme